MKIIKQGKTLVEMWPYTLTFRCFKCDCEFRLESGDHYAVKSVSSGDQREDGEWVHVACPNCHTDCSNR